MLPLIWGDLRDVVTRVYTQVVSVFDTDVEASSWIHAWYQWGTWLPVRYVGGQVGLYWHVVTSLFVLVLSCQCKS